MTLEPDPDKTFRRDLRRTIRSRLEFVPIEERRLELDAVSDKLPAPDRPLRILCYLGDGVEIDLDPVIHQLLHQGADVAVPAVLSEAGHMQAIRLSSMESAEFETDRYGIRVPREPWSTVEVDDLDAILVPGVAFTPAGDRLGRGGGYYDRLLARTPDRVMRIGICHRVQIVDRLPVQPHDARMHDLMILESR
ncbi:MAG: 5-formyltetrahydrofolate cyclo-ligase [Planctomycetaceae bacterium]|nr:5-formyltetrahydrofolate cyclo-ligase [Planctomycetaceae bacterium]